MGGYRRVLKRVLMSVDFPRPDSPVEMRLPVEKRWEQTKRTVTMTRTDDHGGKLEALPHALPVYLVGEIGKTNVSHELLANNVGGTAVGCLGERRA